MSKTRCLTQPFVIVGCFIEKDKKFLLVQEVNIEKGKWNQPAGWLNLNEDIISGAKREAEEETGLELKVKGLLGIYYLIKKFESQLIQAVKIIFTAEIIKGKKEINRDEMLDVKWFSLEEIEKLEENDQLRDPDIINEVKDYLNGKIHPLEIIHHYQSLENK